MPEQHHSAGECSRRSFLGMSATAAWAVGSAAAMAPAGRADDAPIIDCHVHLKHGDAAGTEWSADSIVELMDDVGIARSIVFAMKTTTVRSIEMAAAAVEKYPDRLIPFLYGLPSYEIALLPVVEQAVTQQGFRGIKLHVGECTLAEYVIDPLLRLAGTFPIPCLVDVSGNAAVAARLAKTFPQTPFWFAHMGRYNSTDAAMTDQFIRLAEEFDNVWLDLSAVGLPAKIGEAVARVGARRLVWGTDGPYKNPTAPEYARAQLDNVRKLEISDEDKRLILGGNVARLLNLK
ncbi:MAG: amidohydrolase family protein [Planctomycetaceae bacterium]